MEKPSKKQKVSNSNILLSKTEAINEQLDIRALEFYSGIGGFRLALQKTCEELKISYRVVESFDINVLANKVYLHNFQHQPKQARNGDRKQVQAFELLLQTIDNTRESDFGGFGKISSKFVDDGNKRKKSTFSP